MKRKEWEEFEVCMGHTEYEVSPYGVERYPYTRMRFNGFTLMGCAEYRCPVCSNKRYFREKLIGGGVAEVSKC
jgi:hypothetical protein